MYCIMIGNYNNWFLYVNENKGKYDKHKPLILEREKLSNIYAYKHALAKSVILIKTVIIINISEL